MVLWKRNLAFCWFGMFVTMVGMSQIAPVLPLYIEQLGIHDTAAIEKLTGFAYGITFVVSAIFAPIWGLAADKVGRKPMLLRASLGMAIVIFSAGFAQNVFQLVLARALQGVISGYGAACTTLIATQTNKEHAGYALGTLATAGLAGNLLGPMIGGVIQKYLGLRPVFWITGSLILIAFVTTIFFVKENFERSEKKALSMKQVWKMIPDPYLILALFLTFFMLNLALNSIEPIVTVYVKSMIPNAANVGIIAGATFSASGFASVLAASSLGKLSDRIGSYKVMLVALIVSFISRWHLSLHLGN